MKYKAQPQSFPERFALWAGMVPMPLLDTLFPLVKTRSLMAGLRLGVFEALRAGPAEASALAETLKLDAESLELLLRVLAASDYLVMKGSRFRLSPMARKTLLRGAPMDSRGYVEFNYMQWRFLDGLEDLVKSGTGLDFHRTMRDTWAWESYQRGMLEIALLHAPLLARHVPVRAGAVKLLDLAGSHGLLGAAICKRHPPMRSTVLDLPEALASARGLAREAGIADLVEHIAGDILKDDFQFVPDLVPESASPMRSASPGNPADVVLLANILHHFTPDQNQDILNRVHRSLKPGGTVAIWDIEKLAKGKPPELGHDASALYFRLTSTSRCFSASDYREWLTAAGFQSIQVKRSLRAPLHFLIHARRAKAVPPVR